MEPVREYQVTLVDLLDRVLDKGLVIQADLIISVAGIPLIGLNLRAAIAGMETMVKYGIMRDWDEAIRAQEGKTPERQSPTLAPGEEIIDSMLGSKLYIRGIYDTWVSGRIFLTNKRIILYQRAFHDTVFETPIEKIERIAPGNGENSLGMVLEEIQMVLNSGELVSFRVESARDFMELIDSLGGDLSLELDAELIQRYLPPALYFLDDGEELLCRGKAWHLASPTGSPGLMGKLWRPGTLYLTDRRLAWVSAFDAQSTFEVKSTGIRGATLERRRPSEVSKERLVMDIIYINGKGKEVASFAGADALMSQWQRVLERVSKGEFPQALGRELDSGPA